MRRTVFVALIFGISTSCSLCAELPEPPGHDAGTDACMAESREELCEQAGLACGTGAITDRCGSERSIDCGTCADTDVDLGDMAPDVAMCGDCSGLDAVCAVGVCDEATGECVAQLADDGTACPDDGLACTTDACEAGGCVSTPVPGFCVIDGICFAAGEGLPGLSCAVCDPSVSTSSFTMLPTFAACDDGDARDCTEGRCDAAGTCVSAQLPDTCLVDGTCYVNGEVNPASPCEVCDATAAPDVFSQQVDGAGCSSTACTTGICSGGACINESVSPNTCRIGGVCYLANAADPNDDCQRCDPADPTVWSNAVDGTGCGNIANCTCAGGECRKPNDMICN